MSHAPPSYWFEMNSLKCCSSFISIYTACSLQELTRPCLTIVGDSRIKATALRIPTFSKTGWNSRAWITGHEQRYICCARCTVHHLVVTQHLANSKLKALQHFMTLLRPSLLWNHYALHHNEVYERNSLKAVKSAWTVRGATRPTIHKGEQGQFCHEANFIWSTSLCHKLHGMKIERCSPNSEQFPRANKSHKIRHWNQLETRALPLHSTVTKLQNNMKGQSRQISSPDEHQPPKPSNKRKWP